MKLSKVSPSLRLALTLAIVSIIALAQPLLGADRLGGRVLADATNQIDRTAAVLQHPSTINTSASSGWMLSAVRGDLASMWSDRAPSLNGILMADSGSANPIQHAMGCSCAQCSGIGNSSLL